jgi:hypothetical protein
MVIAKMSELGMGESQSANSDVSGGSEIDPAAALDSINEQQPLYANTGSSYEEDNANRTSADRENNSIPVSAEII